MANEFYTHGSYPVQRSLGASANARAEFALVSAGFDKLPTLSGQGSKIVHVNAGGTALVHTTNFTFSGSTLRVPGNLRLDTNTILVNAGADTLTLPTGASDTVALLAAAQTFTNKTLTAPVLGGTVTGTYTLGGTLTITAPILSGNLTGTYALAGTPSLGVDLNANAKNITGIAELAFGDGAAAPTAVGRLRRNGVNLGWHDGTNTPVFLTGDVGTKAVFQQTAAPTGWTKDTTHNDKALRVVTGTASDGGSDAFTTAFGAGKTTGGHTLTEAEMPSHDHDGSGTVTADAAVGGSGRIHASFAGGSISARSATLTMPNTGGGDPHDHTLALDLAYVDVIVATKD